ncbi:DNA replication protein DnaD [Streptococcus agalactiae]|uniref:DNA replication protein DnaD n=1 Tax=Streptococcus agalactiae CCUG 29376 TaxID=1105255 RepID=A0AAV3JKW4_STRAG|nr:MULTISPECIES: DnaD domain-containing protein [Streptococcus]EAO78756.1 DNA replication protein DnaD, putative [Streptococcus agalactiae H36B]MEE3707424.1 DnaD domain-containing protein [Streptococcus sp. R3]ABA45505.1 DNA replication protein DnaD, putative [Streptococcus agalactiae A909]AFS45942.1 DNA replication protein DnaD [Streptococcus agalactiae GD201008-001]AKT96285.1 DNA replication protein DnaD [Streptococcus agalactiae]
MTYLEQYQSGQLTLPSALFFHFKSIFKTADDFLVWQFFYLQNTTNLSDLTPSRIATSLDKTVADINRSISNLTSQGLLDVKTIELNHEIEIIFDTSPVFTKLDKLFEEDNQVIIDNKTSDSNRLKDLVGDFERELGRLLSPFELEDLQKTLQEDQTDPDIVRAALREAVFNGKTSWNYINAILRNWRREGLTTLRQIEERKQAREDNQMKDLAISDDFKNAMNLWE